MQSDKKSNDNDAREAFEMSRKSLSRAWDAPEMIKYDIDSDAPGETVCSNCGVNIPDSDSSDPPMCGECYLLLQDNDIW